MAGEGDFGAAALTSRAFFAWAREGGVMPVSLFSCPGVTTATVCIDWMHTVDLGVAQEVVGAVLFCSLQALPGEALRLQVKWQARMPVCACEGNLHCKNCFDLACATGAVCVGRVVHVTEATRRPS